MTELTGERPLEGATPDSLLALHRAGYREVAARLDGGSVLDVGCGVGAETSRLAADNRWVVGVDYDSATAATAARAWAPTGLRFAAMDGSRLGFADSSFDYVCSSHIIEHFWTPASHVAELARVLHDDGTAFVITPNRPADFENPFHLTLFEANDLTALLRTHFGDVEVLGLEGDAALKADLAARRVSGERILRLDPLRLRHRIPRRWYVWAYERLLPIVYRLLGSQRSGVGSGLDESNLFLTDRIEPTTPVLLATAHSPRRRSWI